MPPRIATSAAPGLAPGGTAASPFGELGNDDDRAIAGNSAQDGARASLDRVQADRQPLQEGLTVAVQPVNGIDDRRVDEIRTHGADANSVRGGFGAQRHRQADDAVFGRGIAERAWRGHQTGERGGVHDVPELPPRASERMRLPTLSVLKCGLVVSQSAFFILILSTSSLFILVRPLRSRHGGATIAVPRIDEPRESPSRNSGLLGHSGAHNACPWVSGK